MSSLSTGRYTHAFLNTLLGDGPCHAETEGGFTTFIAEDRYTLRSIKLSAIRPKSFELSLASLILTDPTLSFAYVSDDKVVLLWLHDYPGWMEFCQPLGITIKPSTTIAKRVTVITRTAAAYLRCPRSEVAIAPMTVDMPCPVPADCNGAVPCAHTEFYDRFLDGANVISTELFDRMVANGLQHVRHPRPDEVDPVERYEWEERQRNRIRKDMADSGGHSLRVVFDQGLLKGHTLVAPRRVLGGNDVLYHEANLKPEFASKDVFALIEPLSAGRSRREHPTVWLDDQTVSWLGDWLFPNDDLEQALTDMIAELSAKLANGNIPDFFTDTSRLHDNDGSLITTFQRQALEFQERGLGIDQSVFLTQRIAQGFLNHLHPARRNSARSRAVRRRYPIPCAWYLHVATDSWLAAAGYHLPPTPRGSVWYHTETDHLIYADLDFADLYERGGGWDLDDMVKAIFRTIDGVRKIIGIRSPNSYGEYHIMDYIEGTPYPTWTRKDGSVVSFPRMTMEGAPPFLEDLDVDYRGMPDAPAPHTNTAYSREFVCDALQTALASRGVFGRRANADIAYYATLKRWRTHQLAPIEAIVDACTKELTTERLAAIDADTEAIIAELVASGQPIDPQLWVERIGDLQAGVPYVRGQWSKRAQRHQELCALFRKNLFAIAQRARDNIDADVLALGSDPACVTFATKMVAWFRQQVTSGGHGRAFWVAQNAAITEKLLEQPDRHRIYDIVLAIAKVCYTHRYGTDYNDAILFLTDDDPSESSVFNLYLQAIDYYGIGKKEWCASKACRRCQSVQVFTDRVEFQQFGIRDFVCRVCVEEGSTR